jgi:SAM-dependent methyltransferase
LASEKVDAIGIDLSLAMALSCARSGHTTAVQDMESLGLRPVFDWVLCIGALEFVENPLKALGLLSECLAPGGSFVLLYPRRGLLGALYALYHRSHGTRIHTFDEREIRALLVRAGFAAPRVQRRCFLANVCVTTLAVDDPQ